ncbi:MAG: hypothetical protein Q8S58_18730, partial [Bosea sp. (in: a-proteobacteria)]|nr:hypothetical protein [Bosea sp. (in: a-proteobacteria)]
MGSGFVGGRLIAALAALGLVVATAAPSRAQAPTQPPVILTLSGAETPDAVSRMVEALARDGRQVEIRIAGTTPAKAGPAAPQPSATTAAETTETTIDALVDHIVEGIDYGTASVPRIAELADDWERAWRVNRNGTAG